jgi:hypothetical protein
MPSWGNTDANTARPHFPEERQVRIVATTTTANVTNAGNTVIRVTDTTGIAVGQFVYGSGPGVISATGQRDFWKGNNTVSAINGSNITLSTAVTANIPAGNTITFDAAVVYNSNVANTYYSDTILITPSRMANTQGTTGAAGSNVANTKLGNFNAGWNKITRKINNDGTIRFLKETLVALANCSASNTSSANTSANAIFGGI